MKIPLNYEYGIKNKLACCKQGIMKLKNIRIAFPKP